MLHCCTLLTVAPEPPHPRPRKWRRTPAIQLYSLLAPAALPPCCRPTIIVNLDPANESVPYDCAINITSLIALPDVAEEYHLGPNGGEERRG